MEIGPNFNSAGKIMQNREVFLSMNPVKLNFQTSMESRKENSFIIKYLSMDGLELLESTVSS